MRSRDPADPVVEQMPLLAGLASASIQELVASGPQAGHPVRRLRISLREQANYEAHEVIA